MTNSNEREDETDGDKEDNSEDHLQMDEASLPIQRELVIWTKTISPLFLSSSPPSLHLLPSLASGHSYLSSVIARQHELWGCIKWRNFITELFCFACCRWCFLAGMLAADGLGVGWVGRR